MLEPKESLSYRNAGVDTKKASLFVDAIKHIAKRTYRSEILSGIGGFSGLFELPSDYSCPVLVSGTDGVGTKLKLATRLNQHDTIGIDLVAMCVNDVITSGANPLFFLDYYATGHLDINQARRVLVGIGKGCTAAGMALIGGETAEMPGFYASSEYNLAGFCVGIVEKKKIIDGKKIQLGDTLIALASSGPHANGYSLIYKILDHAKVKLTDVFENTSFGESLLIPTRIYARAIKQVLHHCNPHAIAHITGGGLIENISRVLPSFTQAVIRTRSWTWPTIFQWIQREGNVTTQDMIHTFNVGVGMILCVAKKDTNKVLDLLFHLGEKAWIIGEIQHSIHKQPRVLIN
ncbi:phosphoribosylformylglycinamidine cyclo-ligase [Coxiella endosymbiont of Amblyomma americanum]|uniref:phosphoribosylformylglycinamidine cyclo-ligase n=1 Tax=Coxiella endosymbiont of Amblyomma americanum TaxID=325775 RepID=UPI0005808428|nr:phosphoribosylformylglycinamidine cyclo-ligase [Coxiella endosymbiont of Amblyomma americanum]AJC50207.1 phosphoribosylaminoimidazole synthetase [Coxiella endosymbiont of Amblyomma americanum]AUJ58568.1 phosphoribosylformylglycinamidine cyclo-ligase [Coxiella-like endosymbiont of Amblyomma americanum]